MSKKPLINLLIAGSITTLAAFANLAQADEQMTIKFSKSSSSYYQMSVQLAQMANANNFKATVEESQGSIQNVNEATLRQGNYVFSTPAGLINQAIDGKKPFRSNDKFKDIRALFPAPSLTMHYVLDAKYKNINDISQLTNQTFIIGKGTFSSKEAEKTFKDLGITGLKFIDVELNSAVDALKNNRVDGFVTAGPYPIPSIMEVAVSKPVKLLSMTDAEIAKTNRTKAIIPKGSYPKIDYDVASTSLPVGIYTTTQMSDATAYQLTKAFWENKAEMAKTNPAWNAVTKDLISTLKIQLHPGAKKYYVEKGWIKN